MTQRPEVEPPEFVDRVLEQAVAAGASDVYWLPDRESVTVRRKTAGREERTAEVPREYGEQCVARVKVLAGLLTYRTSIGQDGVIRNHPRAPGAELRVATLPTSHGERVTIRVLDPGRTPLYLEQLGFTDEAAASLRGMLACPTGMLVLTGPTGSGKTTTIYALIRELLQDGEDPASIITIEDPIESDIEGISQVQVTRSGDEWGYAAALRAALRHDVKTLVIGEMRDREVAKVAIDAALTGHRVVTTYHAGDIPSVYARLLHQGFEPFLVAAAVIGVVSQRLAHRQDGQGQAPVVALLAADDEWRDLISSGPTLSELRSRVSQRPGADLVKAAARMAELGVIQEKDVHLL